MNLNLGDTQLLIQESKKASLFRNQLAYLLATAYWETGRTMRPIKEMGGEKYLKSKKYYPYFGRGYVQLTWDYNYKKAGNKLGVDFIKYPEKLLDSELASKIIVVGMVEGWFTSKKLSDYITLNKSDFVNARKIINGKDKAHEIAEIAKTYDKLLEDSGYGVEDKNIPVILPNEPVQKLPDDPGVLQPPEVKPSEKPSVAPTAPKSQTSTEPAWLNTLIYVLTKLFGGTK